jgi:UDP-glucose 4-epimerase
MSKVLITGGAGFIGSHLARRLADAGEQVVLYDIREPGPEARFLIDPVSDLIEFARGGVDDFEATLAAFECHQPRRLVHIAAIVNPDFLAERPREAFAINVGGTVNALEAARLTDVERVVYFRSITALTTLQYQPVDASHPVILAQSGPSASFYGAAKLSGEAFCFAYEESFGLDFIALRPSAVYGFGMQWPLFIKPMVEAALAGRPLHFDHGRGFYRDYTYCKDVAQLAHKALDVPLSRPHDRIFYAATGQPPVTTDVLARTVAEIVPGAEISVDEGLTEAERVDLRYRGQCSIENAREQLGYEPEYPSVRAGIADYVSTQRVFLARKAQPQGAR